MNVYALKQGKRYIGWTWNDGAYEDGFDTYIRGLRRFIWCDVEQAEKFDTIADAGFFANQYGFVDAMITPVTPVVGPDGDGGQSIRCAA